MKGISLPINTIIIIALGVLVLLAIAAWFASQSNPQQTNYMVAWQQACNLWELSSNCNQDPDFYKQVKGIDLNGDGIDDTIQQICGYAIRTTNYEDCKKACCGTGLNITVELPGEGEGETEGGETGGEETGLSQCIISCNQAGYYTGQCVVNETECEEMGGNVSTVECSGDFPVCCCFSNI